MGWVLALGACAGAGDGADGQEDEHGRAGMMAGAAAPAAASEVEPVEFACDPAASAGPAELRRLTMTQYRNTVRDLTRWALRDATEAAAVVTFAGLDRVPDDRRQITPRDPHGSLRRLDQAVDQRHVDETHAVALVLGEALTTPSRLGTVVGDCATDPDGENDEECVSEFIRRFGERALRRPLDDADAAFYRAVYGGDPVPSAAGFADVIAVMLSAPEFLYFVEHGDDPLEDAPGTYALSPFELASRLSYHFWQTLPDDELWRHASDGTLLEQDVLAGQVRRLMDDPRTRETMAELFGDWLQLEELPALDAHLEDPAFAAFAGDDLPGPELRQQAMDEALDLLAHYTWTAPAGLEAVLTSDRSFARDAALARIYGAEPWDGAAAPPALPAGERAGLLSRVWFLASGSVATRPIRRGVFIRTRLLCDALDPPPANVGAIVPKAHADQTTREAIEELTEQPGTACAGCHATSINPLGFAYEGFDALGRVRSDERRFDEDGSEVAALPVDTTSVPHVTAGDDRVSSGPAELTRWMLESGKLEACLARHYFRFVFGRYEDPARDGCALERLRARLSESGRLRDMIEEAGLLTELRRRRFDAEELP